MEFEGILKITLFISFIIASVQETWDFSQRHTELNSKEDLKKKQKTTQCFFHMTQTLKILAQWFSEVPLELEPFPCPLKNLVRTQSQNTK